MRPVARAAGWTAVIAGLAAVFAAYTSPDLVVELARQLWACF